MKIVTKSFKKALVINVVRDTDEKYVPLYNNNDFVLTLIKNVNREDLRKFHICLYNREIKYKELLYLHKLAAILYTINIKLIIHFNSNGIQQLKYLLKTHKDIRNMDAFMICKDNGFSIKTNSDTSYFMGIYGIIVY